MRKDTWEIALPKPPKGIIGIPSTITGRGADWTRPEIQRALEAVKKSGNLVCLCRTDITPELRSFHSRKMPVRPLRTIVRNADTEHRHDGECFFFRERDANSGQQAYENGVLIEEDDGSLKIRLATSLTPRPPGEPRETPVARPHQGRTRSQRAMTQRGFLDLLFDRAGVNLWKPAYRPYREPGMILGKLLATAQRVYSARRAISDRFAICWPVQGRNYRFNGWAYKARTEDGFRGLVLGVVASIDTTNKRLTLEHETDAQFELVFDDIAWAHLQRSFHTECGLAAIPSARIYGLFTCDFRYARPFPDKSVAGDVVDFALIATERDTGIPVASQYELRMAQALIAANRCFRKPLRFDAGEDLVFPDFILTDRPQPVAIEVWGLNTKDYNERKAEKLAFYGTEYPGRLIEWHAYRGDCLPPQIGGPSRHEGIPRPKSEPGQPSP